MNNDAILQALGSSAASSCLTATLLQPFDRLKTVKQQLNTQKSSSWRLAKSLVKNEGILSLWNGLSPTLIRVVPGASFYLCMVNFFRSSLKIEDRNHTGLFLTGFGSRTLVAVLMQPTIVLKTRLESSIYTDKFLVKTLRDIVRSSGLKGLWRGLLPTLLRDAPFSGLYLIFYRRQIRFFEELYNSEVSLVLRLASGLNAGFLACFITQPFDIVKTVILLYPHKFNSSIQTSMNLYKSGGFKIFFTGFLLRATKRTLMAALNWAIFDELLNYNRRKNHSDNKNGP